MTKARDLAGFASSSVTTTASDGLVLKGDGSTTDVIIKNGADATVASVADGTVNIAAAGSITATGASVGALARGAIQVGNSSGVAAALAKGAAGTFLTSNGTDLSYAAISTGTAAAIMPSNWASPDETFTSSATYSKHSSLADDDYIWFYLVSGGGGAGTHSVNAFAGLGGAATLVYGKAGDFHQSVMVIGAGGAGTTTQDRSSGGASTLTLRANIGARVFDATNTTPPYLNPHSFNASVAGTYVSGAPSDPYRFNIPLPVTVSGTQYTAAGFGSSPSSGQNILFGGAGGGTRTSGTTAAAGISLFGGAAGGSEAAAGSAPGGGGACDHQNPSAGGQGGAGAAGNIRVYHVS